jgi:hypothetical protein
VDGVRGWGGEAAGGMRGGGQLEVSHSWVSCSVAGGEGGELSGWERKRGRGEGREGLIFTSYFYTRGEFSLLYIGWGGVGLPFFPETFIFIGIVLLNRDLNLGGN